MRNYKASRDALAFRPKAEAEAGSDAAKYLHSQEFYAKKAIALKQRYKLMQNLYALSPDTIGPQITALEKQIMDLAKAYKKDTLSPKEDKALADRQKAATKGTVVNTTA